MIGDWWNTRTRKGQSPDSPTRSVRLMEKSVLRPRTVDALCTLKLVFEPIRNRWGWGLDDWLITGEGTGRSELF